MPKSAMNQKQYFSRDVLTLYDYFKITSMYLRTK